ncbi:unnamed protein product [Plutella xylostella]|uniref:(diamondback moth) hypothetical protein n=1 Tax=Plutella xylostella TaxID=51655 RepID=A0A8S4FTZ0_PLUXY|nr:unnamed protein product [Plutella xylostella]
MSEPTCAQPTPASRGLICDFSACYCDAPTVRHEGTDQCVRLEDCVKHVSYAVGCATVMSEPTCAQPTPASRGLICDFSACYCDAPTVRHEGTDKCVRLEDCDKVE